MPRAADARAASVGATVSQTYTRRKCARNTMVAVLDIVEENTEEMKEDEPAHVEENMILMRKWKKTHLLQLGHLLQ